MTRHLSAVPDAQESEPPAEWSPLIPKRPLALPKRFSFSAADTYEQCPRKWQAKYQWGLHDPPGAAAAVGTMAHAVLERFGSLPGWARTGRGMRWALRRAVEDLSDPNRPHPDEPPPSPAIAREGYEIAVTASRLPEVRNARVVSLEQQLTATIAGVPFTGKADKVVMLPSDSPEVVDYKGGKPKNPRARFRGSDGEWVYPYEPLRRQLRLYTSALQRIGVPVAAARIVWLRVPRSDRVDVSDGPVAEAERWLRRQWEALGRSVETGEFEARPGGLCSWCPAVPFCSEGQHAVDEREAAGKALGEHGAAWLAARAAEEAD